MTALPRINEYAVLMLQKETGVNRETALLAYQTANGDYNLARQALCTKFSTNQKMLSWLEWRAKENAYRREQERFRREVAKIRAKRAEKRSVASLKARCEAFIIRVAIDDACEKDAQGEDILVEPVGRLAEGLCR